MKKVLMITLLSGAALMMFANSADAKTFDDKTDVGVSFKSDEPTIPGENKPYKDNLSLVWKPGSFQFGEQQAVGSIATFNNTVEGSQYLVVNDDRPGESLSKWDLKAKLSDLEETGTGENRKKLASKLTFTLEKAQAYAIGDTLTPDGNDYVPNEPTAAGALSPLDANSKIQLGGSATNVNVDMSLEAGNTTAKTILAKTDVTTAKGGVATKISNTKLVVTDAKADGAAGKSFTGQVTWTLDDLATN